MPEPMDKEAHVRARVYSTDYPDLSPEIYSWGKGYEDDKANKPKPHLKFD